MGNFEAYEQFLQGATTGDKKTLPGVVVAAIDANGIYYSHASGTQSVQGPLANKPFSLDTTMWIASCTKLLTSLAALQCVERGQLTADGDLSNILPELKTMKVFDKFDTVNGKDVPRYKENNTPITLRHLLSHSSGLPYAGFDPNFQRIYAANGRDWTVNDEKFFDNIFEAGLKFEPGTSWAYGTGIDVAGLAVERATGLSLGAYFEKEFFKPLDMKSTSFTPTSAIRAERADMSKRSDDGSDEIVYAKDRFIQDDVKVEMGGAGLWSCARDYTKVLQAVLQKPSPLFKDEKTLDLAFTPCLSEGSKNVLNYTLFGDYAGNKDGAIGSMFHGGALPTSGNNMSVDYTMAGLSVDGGTEGKRGGAGKAVSWGGLPNLLWCVDREKGKAVFYGSQILPPGDRASGQAFAKFEALVFGGEGAKL